MPPGRAVAGADSRVSCACWLLHNGAPSGVVKTMPGLAQNFLACDRDQELLLPPSLHEWFPERHLVWFVIEPVPRLISVRSAWSTATTAKAARRATRR